MEYKTKFMEWGIINKDNFTSIKDIPVKRWDPLSTVIITQKDFGLRKRRMRYYGHYAYLSPIRGKRPVGYKKDQKMEDFKKNREELIIKIKDIFTSITEGKIVLDDEGKPIGDGYTIIITEDVIRRDNPFLEIPHRIERVPDSTRALTLINRYPSMARVIDPKLLEEINLKTPSNSKLAQGVNLVTISRNFYPALYFELIPEMVLAGIFISMKAAILYVIEEAIERDFYDIPVSPFFNIGTQVGGSQPRIHSQVYIDLNQDGHGSRLENHLRAFKEMGDDCHLCDTTHGDDDLDVGRTILKTEFWTFYVTGSPVRNYHLRFYPNEHIRRFTQLKVNQLNDLARSLKMVFKALDRINVSKDRNILFTCCPYGYDASFHMFGDIIPHEIIGGAEMADDMRVARRLPENVAIEIKNAILSED